MQTFQEKSQGEIRATRRPLDGKIALVTNGSRRIGAGIVHRLARDGAAVAFTYSTSETKAQNFKSRLKNQVDDL